MSHKRRNRKLSEIISLESPIIIERIAPTGQGVATLDSGKKIFLWNVLPEEEIKTYRLTKKKNSFDEGIALDFKKTSPSRVEPKDEHFLSTSPWQIINDETELKYKKEIIKNLYRNLWQDDIPAHQSPNTWFYRNKMEYSLYYNFESERIELAIHERGSHKKLPIKTSSIERPEIFEKAQKIIDELNATGKEAKNYQSILLRANQNSEVEGGLFEKGKPHPVFNVLEDTILNNKYSYSPNGFFQINLPVYELALTRIKELLCNTDKVVDLYSGVGTIGLSVARDKNLTLVEVDKSAYEELENNCKNIKNAKPVLAKSEDVLEYIEPDSVVILDPPRAGCDKKLIERLIEVKPKKVIYLSCNPITQVRDAELLIESGAKLKSLEFFNFFPHTPHIESLISIEF